MPSLAVGLVAAWAAAGAGAATPTSVTATITRAGIALVPSYVPTGTVVVTVVNRTDDRRDFGVGARRTAAIPAGHSAKLTVTLSGTGVRRFSSTAVGSHAGSSAPGRLTAALHLFEPCADASATTVSVQIDRSAGGLVLSPTVVPCGTVTFAISDVDTTSAVLLVAAAAPPVSGVTRQLDPGGTATLTVQFPAAALVRCSVVQVGGDGVVATVGDGSLTVH